MRVKILEIDSERRRLSLSVKRVEEQLPTSARRPRPAPPRPRGRRGQDIGEVPDLGLSEDVFAGPSISGADALRAALPQEPAEAPPRRRAEEAPAEEAPPTDEAPPLARHPPPTSAPRRPRWEAPAAEEARRPRPSAQPRRLPAEAERRRRAAEGQPAPAPRTRGPPPTPEADRRTPPSSPRPRPGRREPAEVVAGVPFVGLTGGLGAGKSEALRALGELGAATLSTDAVVHELLASDELRDIVVGRLGDEVAPDGALDRR